MTEKEKFEKWFNDNNIMDFRVSLSETARDLNPEDIYGEINRVNEALERGECEQIFSDEQMEASSGNREATLDPWKIDSLKNLKFGE